MKKIFTSLLSAVVIAAPLFAASGATAQDRHHRPPAYDRKVIEKKVIERRGDRKVVTTTRYVRGHKLSRDEMRRFREVRDYRAYRLSAPPRGYHWVRTDRDFILVGIASGIISSVIAGR